MTRPDTTLPLTGSQRQWLRHLRACEAECQTTVAYAKAHGLKVGALYAARRTLVEMGVLPHPAGQRFQRAQVLSRPAQSPAQTPAQTPAQSPTPAPAPWQVQVHLPNGVQVAFTGDVKVAKLRQVLRTAASLS